MSTVRLWLAGHYRCTLPYKGLYRSGTGRRTVRFPVPTFSCHYSPDKATHGVFWMLLVVPTLFSSAFFYTCWAYLDPSEDFQDIALGCVSATGWTLRDVAPNGRPILGSKLVSKLVTGTHLNLPENDQNKMKMDQNKHWSSTLSSGRMRSL